MPVHSLTEALAQHLLREITPDVRTRARLHLLDWLGCVAGARGGEVAAMACRAEPDVLTRAALLGNVLEMDDVHRQAVLHPGPVVWPSVLAAARETSAGMERLLDGAVAGYEATITLGATLDAWHYARWHPTATAGGFGGAAAAARVFALDAGATADALGHAGSLAGGLWQMRNERGMTKQLHVAQASLTGLWHARLARAGAGAPRFILEGPQGLYAATCETPKPMHLGPGWRIAEVSFKPWGACRHAHPAIDAALGLRSLDGPIVVETYADALVFCDRPHPTTPHEAKFSLQHAVAIVAERGAPTLADFEPDAIAALATTRARVTVREDAAITARYPAHYGARVGAAGASVERIDTLGDPERPLSREGVIAKARGLMAWGGVAQDADAAVAACLEGDDPGALLALLEAWV